MGNINKPQTKTYRVVPTIRVCTIDDPETIKVLLSVSKHPHGYHIEAHNYGDTIVTIQYDVMSRNSTDVAFIVNEHMRIMSDKNKHLYVKNNFLLHDETKLFTTFENNEYLMNLVRHLTLIENHRCHIFRHKV